MPLVSLVPWSRRLLSCGLIRPTRPVPLSVCQHFSFQLFILISPLVVRPSLRLCASVVKPFVLVLLPSFCFPFFRLSILPLLLFDISCGCYKISLANPTAGQWCIGRQKHSDPWAVSAGSGERGSSDAGCGCFQSLFGPFPGGEGVGSMRANVSG